MAGQGHIEQLEQLPVVDPAYYEAHGYPHAEWERLRREKTPVRIQSGPIPFWAITRHADITAVSREPSRFLNAPRMMIREDMQLQFPRPPTVIEMDPPIHRPFRRIITSRFTPRALKKIHVDVDRIAAKIVDDLFAGGDEAEVDFVAAVAAPLPITVIGWLLGVPEEDWGRLYDWTNRMAGTDDPDFQPEDGAEGDGEKAVIELFQYFGGLLERKRNEPADDLVTVLLRAEVEGRRLEPIEILSYCLAIVFAGNETTRNATSAGLLALIEHPDQLRRLQQDPALLGSAVEEILRWTSPLVHFARTAAEDTELAGARIREGDALALFYPSANRDEAVFDDPHRFDIARSPNRHLAFGVGEHFCAGAHVARLELAMAFKHLVPRLAEVELAGPVARLRSSFVGGIKRLPIRYRIAR